MATNWKKVAESVSAALQSVGFSCTIERAGISGGDPWNPVASPPDRWLVRGVEDFGQFRFSPTPNAQSVPERTKRILIEANVVEPRPGDRIVLGVKPEDVESEIGEIAWHTVREVSPISPGDVDVGYEIEVTV